MKKIAIMLLLVATVGTLIGCSADTRAQAPPAADTPAK
jgi:hypothetical protein